MWHSFKLKNIWRFETSTRLAVKGIGLGAIDKRQQVWSLNIRQWVNNHYSVIFNHEARNSKRKKLFLEGRKLISGRNLGGNIRALVRTWDKTEL